MKRREVVALLVGGFVEWPLATHAQPPPAMPIVGFLSGRSSSEAGYAVAAFRQGLGEKLARVGFLGPAPAVNFVPRVDALRA